MLASLDTLIAFALIFTVVSLLITTVVQMISAAFNLRGINLYLGLVETLKTIDPKFEDPKVLAKQLLKSSFLSDNGSLFGVRYPNAVRPQELFDLVLRIKHYPDLLPKADAGVDRLLKALGVDDPGKPLEQMTDEVKAAYARFEQWFETGQERAQQWFTTHTGYVTFGLSIIAAFGLQLDTVEIFRTASNPQVNKQLVEQASSVQELATKVMGSPAVLETALDAWRNDEANAGLKDKAKGVAVALNDTRGEVRKKLADAMGQPPDEAALTRFDTAVDAAAKAAMDQEAGNFNKAVVALAGKGFELVPSSRRWPETENRKHVLGELFTILLLSLGAPFWFNTLKQLTSLRPLVQGNITSEKDQKKDDPTKPGRPPVMATSPPPPVAPAAPV